MNCLPSPPSSPYLTSYQEVIDNVTCGGCDKILGSDWFCSDCHQKCSSCNRFLSQDEYCSRCWCFDVTKQRYIRKSTFIINYISQQQQLQYSNHLLNFLPTPSNSTGSDSNNKTLYNNK